jgi:predicted  nucleic acid-binding Zn-ribbon protein
MSEIVLEQRVTEVEKQIIRLGRKMDGYGKDSHESLTRLEDWLIQYSIENQKGIKESQRWRKSMEEKHQEHDQELKELRKSLADSQQRTEQGFVELRKSLADSKRDMALSQQRTEQGFQELRKDLADSQQRTEQGFQELRKDLADSQQRNDQGFKELRKKIADSRKELGQISHRLGTIVEDLVAPSLPRVFREIVKCPADVDVLINVRVRRRHPSQKGKMLEIDAMADCGNYVLFNETKSQFSPEKVKAFLDKLALVRDYFPEYQSHQVRGCIASLYLD